MINFVVISLFFFADVRLELQNMLAIFLLRANRIGQLNRVMSSLAEVRGVLNKMRTLLSDGAQRRKEELLTELNLKLEDLNSKCRLKESGTILSQDFFDLMKGML